jgi:hypothetical protein
MTARLTPLLLLVFLAGCGAVTEPFGLRDPFGVPRPFEGQERNPALAASITEIPAFLVGGIDGMEGEAEDALRQSVAQALQAREVAAATQNPAQGAWLLMGRVREAAVPEGHVAVTPPKRSSARPPKPTAPKAGDAHEIVWLVQDGSGARRAEFTTPFDAQVADRAAARVAAAIEAGAPAITESAGVTSASGPKDAAVAPHAAVLPVKGAPGDGDQALLRAMNFLLPRTGLKVTGVSDPLAWRVEGTVSVENAGAQDQITLKWTVRDGSGRQMGELTQKNAVPARSLAKTWGEVAAYAAAAAVPGVAEIIAKAHNAGLDPRGPQDAGKTPPVPGKP